MNIKLIDTHAHIYDRRFEQDLNAVLLRAREAGVEQIVLPAVDVPSVYHAIKLSEKYPGIYAMAAIHPTHVPEATEESFQKIIELCDHPKVIAVGESGLDYYWDKYYDERQPEFFTRHIRLSVERELPLIIHLRDKQHRDQAHRDAIQILEQELPPSNGTPRGIFHCFTGPEWLPEVASKLGFVIGVGGAVTFKNAGVAKVISKIPLTQIVLETDAPYMSPAPHRGKRNEPAWTALVARQIAEIKNTTVAEVAEITSSNARQLFNLP
ncbi:MAG: TatD family hydrolase [Bacteroidetes bacterium]|nr:TatD family hydrolase [Bacteroidota bacterium]